MSFLCQLPSRLSARAPSPSEMKVLTIIKFRLNLDQLEMFYFKSPSPAVTNRDVNRYGRRPLFLASVKLACNVLSFPGKLRGCSGARPLMALWGCHPEPEVEGRVRDKMMIIDRDLKPNPWTPNVLS